MAHLNKCTHVGLSHSLWPFVFLHLLFSGKSIFTHVLRLALKCSWAAEVDMGKQCFCTPSETGTWNNGIFLSITPELAVAVSLRRFFSGLSKQKEKEWRRKEAGSPVSQFLPQSKTSVRRIWSEDWRLFISVSFMNYVQIGEGGERMWGGTRETLLTNQKAEVKIPFLSHLGYSELGDSFSWL